MKVLAIIFDGFEELEANAPFALLRRAKIDLTIASDTTQATGNHDITITNLTPLSDINYKDYDCLLMPGGPHYKYLRVATHVHEIINYFMNENKVVAAICASPTIIGQLGHLNNRKYTCYTSMNKDFGGTYLNDGVVADGNLITAKSAAYSIDFAYEIIKKLAGQDTLNNVWAQIYYEK